MVELPAFLRTYDPYQRPAHENDLVKKLRVQAYQNLLEHGIPHQEVEEFRYTRFIERLFSEPFQPPYAFEGGKNRIEKLFFPECQESTLVFMNGFFRPDLSSMSALQNCFILPIHQAARSYQPLISSSWMRLLREERDPFALMNLCCHQDGIFIYIPQGKKISAPIHIITAASELETPSWVMPRIQVLLGTGAEATIFETFRTIGHSAPIYHNCNTLFELEENATLRHAHIALDEKGESIIHTDTLRVFLKKDATLTSTSYVAPSIASRRSYAAFLHGEGASATVQGSWMLSGKEEAHVHLLMQHEEPHTKSMQFFKGVVQEESRSSFEGKIYVSEKAQKTEAYQLNNNLILGDSAYAYSKPNLEIFADDVKASHGATTGRISEEDLFYLQARGIDKKDAEKALIKGFLLEAASQIEVQGLQEYIVEKVHQFCI